MGGVIEKQCGIHLNVMYTIWQWRQIMKRVVLIVFSALAIGLVFIGCPEPGPHTYERIVIDTYSPNDSLTADPDDTVDPWTDDDTTDAIAWADDGNPDFASMARIDYTGGLTSGTYYIRVRGKTSSESSYYAIRVLSLNIGDSPPGYIFPGFDAMPDSYEDDDDPGSNWIPLKYITIQLGNANNLSRSIDYDSSVPDVDWFQLDLP
jgi:hypothetical protein